MVVVVAFIKMIQLTNIWKVWSSLCDFRLPLFFTLFQQNKKERKKMEDIKYRYLKKKGEKREILIDVLQ